MNPTDAEIEAAAKNDIRCHKENGVDLNPYTTVSGRLEWQNGFYGKQPFDHMYNAEFSIPRRRGEACARLLKESNNG